MTTMSSEKRKGEAKKNYHDFNKFVFFLSKFKEECLKFNSTAANCVPIAFELRQDSILLAQLSEYAAHSFGDRNYGKKGAIKSAFEKGMKIYRDNVEGTILLHEEQQRLKHGLGGVFPGVEFNVDPMDANKTIPVFGGDDGTTFQSFIEAFDCMVHHQNTPESEKMRMLKFYLTGPPEKLIAKFRDDKPGDYAKAYNMMICTYDVRSSQRRADVCHEAVMCYPKTEPGASSYRQSRLPSFSRGSREPEIPDRQYKTSPIRDNVYELKAAVGQLSITGRHAQHGEPPRAKVIDRAFRQFTKVAPCPNNSSGEVVLLYRRLSEAYYNLIGTQSPDLGNDILVLLAMKMLPEQMAMEFQAKNSSVPPFEKLLDFLRAKASADKTRRSPSPKQMSYQFTIGACHLCKGDHVLSDCPDFKERTVPLQRGYFEIHNKELCMKCMSQCHATKDCVFEDVCLFCKGDHCSALHVMEREVAYLNSKFDLKITLSEPKGNYEP